MGMYQTVGWAGLPRPKTLWRAYLVLRLPSPVDLQSCSFHPVAARPSPIPPMPTLPLQVGHQLVAAYAECMNLPLYRRRITGQSADQVGAGLAEGQNGASASASYAECFAAPAPTHGHTHT